MKRCLLIVVSTVMVVVLCGAGFVRPARAQARIAPDVFSLEADGGYLGIEMQDVTSENMAAYKLPAERGVIVRSIADGSPAEEAKLLAKDVILEYAGTQVQSAMQLARLVRETPPGRKVDLAVSREGKQMHVSLTVGKRSDELSWNRPRSNVRPGGRTFQFRVPEGGGPFGFTFPDDNAEKPRLGVTLEPLTPQMADFLGVPGKKGVLITSVAEGAPAAGKLKAGDVVISAAGRPVTDPQDLVQAVRSRDAGIELKVVREKKEISVSIDLPKDEGSGGYKL